MNSYKIPFKNVLQIGMTIFILIAKFTIMNCIQDSYIGNENGIKEPKTNITLRINILMFAYYSVISWFRELLVTSLRKSIESKKK